MTNHGKLTPNQKDARRILNNVRELLSGGMTDVDRIEKLLAAGLGKAAIALRDGDMKTYKDMMMIQAKFMDLQLKALPVVHAHAHTHIYDPHGQVTEQVRDRMAEITARVTNARVVS